jgi:hypothetical protein
VAPLGLHKVTADPVRRPSVVERLGLAIPVTEVAVDAQRLLQRLGRGRVISCQLLDGPELVSGPGRAGRIVAAMARVRGEFCC